MNFQFRKLLLAAVLPMLVMIATPADAVIIKFDFEGEVTSSDSSEIFTGDAVTGDFIYDPDAVTSSFPVMPGTSYRFSPDGFVINIKIGAFTFTASLGSDLFILNDSPGDELSPLADAGAGTSPSDFSPTEMYLRLLGTSDFLTVAGDVLPDDPSQIDVTEILSGTGNISSDAGNNIWFDIYTDSVRVSAVPVPPAVWLFGSGLIGLVGIARRKKTA